MARLAQHGAHVYMGARSEAKATAAIEKIKFLYPQARVTLLQMDHLSLSSVVSAAKWVISQEPVLHGLVNNAGIMATPYQISKDGYEAQWQTNYLAHWVLTAHLLPLLLRTSKTLPPGSVRIVNLSSVGHRSAPNGGINFADTALPNASVMTRYGQSKLANVLHIKTINKLYGPDSPSAKAGRGEIWATAVHPGFVETNLAAEGSELPLWMRLIIKPYVALGGRMDADRGSWTSVFCVASPELKREHCGAYFQRIADPAGSQSALAKDMDLAAKLEEWTKKEMKKGGWWNENE